MISKIANSFNRSMDQTCVINAEITNRNIGISRWTMTLLASNGETLVYTVGVVRAQT